jgi:hypothetical protein
VVSTVGFRDLRPDAGDGTVQWLTSGTSWPRLSKMYAPPWPRSISIFAESGAEAGDRPAVLRSRNGLSLAIAIARNRCPRAVRTCVLLRTRLAGS